MEVISGMGFAMLKAVLVKQQHGSVNGVDRNQVSMSKTVKCWTKHQQYLLAILLGQPWIFIV